MPGIDGGYRFCCLHCLTPDSSTLKLDKKGRPFSYCGMCGSRTFMHHPIALRGVRLIAPGLVETYQQLYSSLPQEDQHAQELLTQMRRGVMQSVPEVANG